MVNWNRESFLPRRSHSCLGVSNWGSQSHLGISEWGVTDLDAYGLRALDTTRVVPNGHHYRGSQLAIIISN